MDDARKQLETAAKWNGRELPAEYDLQNVADNIARVSSHGKSILKINLIYSERIFTGATFEVGQHFLVVHVGRWILQVSTADRPLLQSLLQLVGEVTDCQTD